MGLEPERATPIPDPSLLRLGSEAEIGFEGLKSAELFFGFVVGNTGYDDDVATRLPVHRCGNLVLGRELNGIQNSQYFIKVAAGAHRIADHQLDLLVRTNHEY